MTRARSPALVALVGSVLTRCCSYVTVTLFQKHFQTPAISANLDPEFPAAQSTFEFPIFASLIEGLGALELIVWDKNILLKKEYLGEVAIPIGEWFAGTALTFDDPGNTVSSSVSNVSL